MKNESIYRNLGYAALLSSFVIAVLNVVLIFGFAEGHELAVLRYTLYAIMASFPIVVVGGALHRTISHKKGRKYFLIPRKERDKGILRIRKNEFIIADSTPHPLYFFKLAIALGSSTFLFIFLSLSYETAPGMENGLWWWKLLILSGILVFISYIFSIEMFPRNSYIASFAHTWSLIYAFWWGISAAGVMKIQVEMVYPQAFWEKFLGLPSIAMIMFAVILFLVSGMLWRIDSYLSGKEPGPIGTISLTLMAAGIAALFPPLWFLFSELVRNTFFLASIFLGLIFWLLLSLFLYYKGGMKFVFTNRRIISVRDFFGRDIREHPYDSILSVEIVQGILGERFDFGDLKFTVRRGKTKVGFTVHGVKNQALIKNMVLALSSRPHKKKNAVKKVYRKKRYHLEPY